MNINNIVGNMKKTMPASESETGVKPDRTFLVYDKASENLIEISLVFASLQAGHEKLCDIDSITWKQLFVEWANEFEAEWAGTDWNQDDYLEEIDKFARQKILKYARLEDCRTI